ncbi:helix-turn-helix transcriptional regulator [Streptomyces sp. SID3343]|uniref:helix-turn-helix transcriptional regulator n=1 Tax=Streptomyces sp. SID3343 TaxID=2690260 RepID=UPI00136F4D8E|nr:helix-turn-helix transcriptional regulator [Streptomyces sp. SID3343]MYW03929.1 helix-turn-helix domain-containing protein [Streptomyces sp. SID3343]
MSSTIGLGEFLRARREHLRPEDVGLTDFGGRRRVAGLRREELAGLAGMSVDYYTRMEQGRVKNASASVLDALARALRLDAHESEHLHRIARPVGGSGPTARTPRPARQTVRPTLGRLLTQLSEVPAMVLGRNLDILAWNPAATALFGDFGELPPAERNMIRITFLQPRSRELWANWAECGRESVAFLRREAGLRPHDPRLAALVGELSVKSPEFRTWWAEHTVREKTSGVKRFRHPLVGRLDLTYDTLRSGDDPNQALVTYVAEPGSPSQDALRMLLSWSATPVG